MTVENLRKWVERNPDRALRAALKYHRKWNKEHREQKSEIQRKWREKNREKTRKYSIQNRIARKQKWYDFIASVIPFRCEKCGYDKCKEALEFHHRFKHEKKIAISVFINRWGLTNINKEAMLEELIKCQILCANCHRELHAEKNYQTRGNTTTIYAI